MDTPEIQPTPEAKVELDEATQKRIAKAEERRTALEDEMKQLEEEIGYLQQLGEKKAKLAQAREQSAQLREEISQLKEAKKKPEAKETTEEIPEETPVNDEPMTLKGHKPGDAEEVETDKIEEKKAKLNEGFQQYLKNRKPLNESQIKPIGYRVSMG
jgi:chromosome segregation ATPase